MVETTFTFSQLKEKLCSEYPWSLADTVDMKYFNFGEERYLPLMSDLDLGMLFSLNAAARFGRIRIRERGLRQRGLRHHLVVWHHQVVRDHVSLLTLLILAALLVGPQQYHLHPMRV